MKKGIAVILTLTALFLSSCGENKPANPVDKASSISSADSAVSSYNAQQKLWRENSDTAIKEVKDELESKGWNNIEVVEGEADSSRWGGLVLEDTVKDVDFLLYTVIGQVDGKFDNPISVVVKIVFTSEYPKGARDEVFYVSKAGRYESAEHFDPGGILIATDKELWDYMYSY